MQLLEVVVAMLSAITILHLFVTFGLIARFRAYQSSTALVPRDPDLPSPGDVVRAFDVTSTAGVPLSAATLSSGETLVGFFIPHCGPCEQARAKLVDDPPPFPMLAFIDGSADDAACQQIGNALGAFAQVAYTTPDDAVARAFRHGSYPTFIRVANGTVAASSHDLRDVLA